MMRRVEGGNPRRKGQTCEPTARRMLSHVSRLSQLCIALGSVEQMSPAGRKVESGLLAWPVMRRRSPRLAEIPGMDSIMGPGGDRVANWATLAIAPVLSLASRQTFLTRGLRTVQLMALVRQNTRVGALGRDGSDHATIVVQLLLTIAEHGGSKGVVQTRIGYALGLHGLFAYSVSGVSKLASSSWRRGTALSDSLRTVNYGHAQLFRFLESHSILRLIAAWTVIAAETLAATVLFLPSRVRRAYFLAMLTLHLGIAYFMGLNRFFWAFLAFHPAIEFTAQGFTAARQRRRKR